MSTQQQLRLGIHPSVVLISPGAAVYDAVWPMRAHSLLSAAPSSSWLQPAPPSPSRRRPPLQSTTIQSRRNKKNCARKGIEEPNHGTQAYLHRRLSRIGEEEGGSRPSRSGRAILLAGWASSPVLVPGPGGTVYPVEEGLYRGDGPLIALFLLLLVVPHSPTVARVGLGRK